MTRSTWSGGVTWSGTGKWMPDGLTASGPLVPEVAIAGTLISGLQSASWRLGITDFLAELSPGSCSLSFAGDVDVLPGDSIVLSIPAGTLWVGRVDTVNNRRDTAGYQWTAVNGSDSLAALGSARVESYAIQDYLNLPSPAIDVEELAETLAAECGVALDVVDASSGLVAIEWSGAASTYSGDVLSLINGGARATNAMLALQRDGTVRAVIREAVTPADQVLITDRYSERTKVTSQANNINRWIVMGNEQGRDQDDIDRYGDRPYAEEADMIAYDTTVFDDWIAYGGSQRPIRSYTLPMQSWADDDLMLLDPFDWVTADGTDQQIMGLAHSVTASPPLWTVTLDVDNLLDLL